MKQNFLVSFSQTKETDGHRSSERKGGGRVGGGDEKRERALGVIQLHPVGVGGEGGAGGGGRGGGGEGGKRGRGREGRRRRSRRPCCLPLVHAGLHTQGGVG